MINFILILIGFISPNNINSEQNNTYPQIQQNINTGSSLEDNNGGPVGGNTGQIPPPLG
ncbi:hypothetical protein [Chryseobacterium vrystaatense]|uniref:Uncharacterized protein n=1 Tax=Chryseobacterium vrystaatense TaxID=307480 RepID=A0A1M4TWJ8_9FLAO|nr:hypothetical protein [Chryseobacterium vrystaatense]SHE48820.1 hypothetical protein SAMN02787073_0468 [Chryseobacterium vrystaatense]